MNGIREQLAAKLQDGKVRVRSEQRGEGWFSAYIHDGDATAAWMLSALGEITAPAAADPELAAMAAIVTAMDRLDEETPALGTDVHERVIRWAMARWNVRAAMPGVNDGG